jgi:hypothetical protein
MKSARRKKATPAAGGRAAEGRWPGEGGTEPAGRGEDARRAGCCGGDGGSGCERAGHRHGIGKGPPAACPARCSHSLPLAVVACQGIAATLRQRIEAAVEAAGQRRTASEDRVPEPSTVNSS